MTPVPDLDTDTRVLETLTAHRDREQRVVDAYERLAAESDDEAVRYLCRMAIEDERRHHRMVEEMTYRVESWRTGLALEPSTPVLQPKFDPELLDATHALIDLEHEDAKELRRLERELRYSPATSLLPLLAELMVQDSEKHLAVLRFIRAYTG